MERREKGDIKKEELVKFVDLLVCREECDGEIVNVILSFGV